MYITKNKGIASCIIILYMSIFMVIIALFYRSSMLIITTAREYVQLKQYQLITEALITYGIAVIKKITNEHVAVTEQFLVIRNWPQFIEFKRYGTITIIPENNFTVRANLYEYDLLVYVIQCSIIQNKMGDFIIDDWIEQGSTF